jgi:hypothetical protein
MKRMTTLKDHERRLNALESRVKENEQSYSDTQYKHLRRCTRTDLNVTKIMRYLSLEGTTDDEVDEALDEM